MRINSGLLGLGYALFLVAGALTAIVEILLIPTRIGTTLIPIAPVLALVTNIALPAIARGLTDSMLSAAPPFIGWLVTAFAAATWSGGDVLLPAGDMTYVSYGVLLLGFFAGVITVARAGRPGPWTGERLKRFARRRPESGSGSGGAQ